MRILDCGVYAQTNMFKQVQDYLACHFPTLRQLMEAYRFGDDINTRILGLSDEYGSWKIICIWRRY